MVVPMVLLYQRRVRRSPAALYWCSVMYLFGFITNRLNVAVTGMESASGTHYIPKWTEIAVTGAIIAAGFALFGLATKYLPIFPAEEHPVAEARARAAIARSTGLLLRARRSGGSIAAAT